MYLDTSKHENQGQVHGQNGIFLPSLAALSILTITSHHHAHHSHATFTVHHSRPAARLVPAPAHHQLLNREHGTKVTVRDLFGNMPVRVKQRGLIFGCPGEDEKEMDILQKNIVGLLLAWDVPVMIILRSTGSSKKLIIRGKGYSSKGPSEQPPSKSYNLLLTCSILSQAMYIDPSDWETWVKTSARTPFITIQGAISLQPAPSKNVQFIALGVHYLDSRHGGNMLYDVVNRLFDSSSFGKQEDVLDAEEVERRCKDRRFKQDGHTNKQLKGGGKGVDRWPRFSLRIILHDGRSFRRNDVYTTLERESTLSSLLKVLRALIDGFLNDNHFRPRARCSRKHYKISHDSSVSKSSHGSRLSPLRPSSGADKRASPVNQFLGLIPPPVSASQAPANLLMVRKLQKERKRAGPNGATDLGYDFGGSVELPSFSRSRDTHPGEGFSGWSRIKSGKLEGTYDEFFGSKQAFRALPQTSYTAQDQANTSIQALNAENGEGNTELPQDSQANGDCASDILMSYFDAPPLDDPFVEDESHEGNNATAETETNETMKETEQTLTWISPVTKAKVLVNARTGLVVPQKPKRPASASSNSISQSPATEWSRQAVMLKSQKRLTCGTLAPFSTPKPGSWVGDFLNSWQNPVFKPPEESIPQLSFDGPKVQESDHLHGRTHQCSHAEIQKAFTQASSCFSTRLSKMGLSRAQIIAQVDRKFILVGMDVSSATKDLENSHSCAKQLFVLIDQHAADERIRVEELLASLCEAPSLGTRAIRSSLGQTSAIETTLLQKSITFHIQAQEHRLFIKHCGHFADWGILFDVNTTLSEPTAVDSATCKLTVRTLPAAIAERCRIDPKLLLELMRGEIWKREELGLKPKASTSPMSSTTSLTASSTDHSWLSKIPSCPIAILDMLNSRSCRSAIMFNDVLTMDECNILITRLAKCVFPFQCAHGRPSMVPLMEIGNEDGLGVRVGRQDKERGGGAFGKEWRRWRRLRAENPP